MAFVTELNPGPAVDAVRRHRTSSATWRRAFRDGEPVFQLDTYGSPERQDQGTVSQSIQLDRAGAQHLVDVMREIFPDIR